MRWLWQVGALAIMIAGGWLGMRTLSTPEPVPASAPASVFSAERAGSELAPIAKAPHAVGSEEHQAVLMLLTDRLRSMGFEVEIQGGTGFNRLGEVPRAAVIRNIIARRRGTASTGTLLLMAHYDAAPRALGAGDDGSGVATILETVRALKDSTLRNDLMVVFTDAEEGGLLGAEAFANLHALASDVQLILNFDARGDRGPVYLFETSRGNRNLMRIVNRAGTPLLTSSFTVSLYRLLPNDTDLSIFLNGSRPVAGLNFAMIDGFQNYHSPSDDMLRLDPGTLQQMGDYALPLTRAFGQADLRTLSGPDAVYFTAPLIGLVSYPEWLALPLAILLLLGVLVFAIMGKRSGLYGLHGGFWGILAVGMLLVVPTALSYAGWRLVSYLHPGYHHILHGEPYNGATYFVGFAVLAITLGIAMQQMFVIRLRPLDLVVPTFLIWSLLGIATAIWLPGASYLLAWPLLASLIGAAWWLHGAPQGLRRQVGTALCAVPAFFLFAPLLRMAETAMTMSLIPVLVLLMMLVLSLAALPILLVGHTWRWILPLGLVAGTWAVVQAELHSKFSPEGRHPDSLVYLLDADADKAWWLTFDGETDPFTSQVLGDSSRRASFGHYHLMGGVDSLLSSAAPVDPGVSPARVDLLSSTPVAGGRRVHFRITAAGSVERASIHMDRVGVQVTDVVIDGRRLLDADSSSSPYAPRYRIGRDGTLLLYYGMPAAGIDVECTLDAAEPVSLLVSIVRDGLPAPRSGALVPRGNDFIAKSFIPTDVSIVTKMIRI